MCWVYDGEQKSVPILAGGVGKSLSIAFMLMGSCVLRAVIGLGDRPVVTG